jgi:hypothetical protein
MKGAGKFMEKIGSKQQIEIHQVASHFVFL